jgi:spore maturation protein CgeB
MLKRFSDFRSWRGIPPALERGTDLSILLPQTRPRRRNAAGHFRSLKIVFLGLPENSSRAMSGAAHIRSLVRELGARGHEVLSLERSADPPDPDCVRIDAPGVRAGRYSNTKELKARFGTEIRDADFVVVGSCIQDGIAVGEWVTRAAHGATAFYDLDAAATVTKLNRDDANAISRELIQRYRIYLSTTGGPILDYIEKHFGSPMARPLYCSVDAMVFHPEQQKLKWDLGYVGAYDEQRQPMLDQLLLQPARTWNRGRFVVVGSRYPRKTPWPENVTRSTRLSAAGHRAFYNSLRFALNFKSADHATAGFSPGVRLLEAAACATPVISGWWEGLDSFFEPGKEILVSRSAEETLAFLREIPEIGRRRIGYRARERVLAWHTSRHRALEFESYAFEIIKPALARQ